MHPHPLVVFLRAAGLSRRLFIEQLRAAGAETISVAYLNQIVIGHRHPSRELALLIERVSGGDVTFDSLLRWERQSVVGG